RPLHLVEKLARVRGERFHIPPLALGIDGVERQRRFSGSAKPGDYGQRIARNFHIDVLQIMLARAMDSNTLEHWNFVRRLSVLVYLLFSFDLPGGAIRYN